MAMVDATFARKRTTTRPLQLPPLLVRDVPEIAKTENSTNLLE
jgi:hypothetical protein